MTDKERSEKAKKILNHIKGYDVYDGGDDIEVFEWLIQQAERVQELEKENKRLEDFIETIQNVHFVELQREKAENRRYRKALELLVKQETLGKDVKTGKTAVSHTGMIALKGLNAFDVDNYIVYGVDEVIESVLEDEE